MLGINSFRQIANANAGATLKLEGGQLIDRQNAAPKGFYGRAVTFLRDHSLLPKAASNTMQSFKTALEAEHGKEATRLMTEALSSARKELARLDETYSQHGYPLAGKKGGMAPDLVKETRARLMALVGQGDLGSTSKLSSGTVTNADRLTGILAQHKNDPMLKFMGPTKFLGYMLSVDQRIAKGSPEVQKAAANMSVPEKVALYGYTCADYKVLNPALWPPPKQIDPGLQSYIDHATAAIGKAPMPKPDPKSGLLVTERGLNNPPHDDKWVEKRYNHGQPITEEGFYSTTAGKGNGTYMFSVISNGGGRDVSGFSAWPAETEVLFPPNTQFLVQKDSQKPNHFIMVEL
jgi:hypothetical protein